MAFPNVIYGDYGDEKETSTTKQYAFGTPMVLKDGRLFRYARAGSVAVVPGKLYDGPSATADHGCGTADNLVVNAMAADSTNIKVRAGGTTAIGTDAFVDGILAVRDDAGEGRMYTIKSNNSAAAGSANIVTVELFEKVRVAGSAETTTVSLRKNLYDSVLLKTADTVSVNAIAGVPAASCAASAYFWIQRSGPCPILTDGTVIIGRPVVAASANQAGGVTPAPSDTSTITNAGRIDIIGDVIVVSASTEYSLINLRLE